MAAKASMTELKLRSTTEPSAEASSVLIWADGTNVFAKNSAGTNLNLADGSSASFTNLSDTNFTSLTDSDYTSYDTSSGKWVNTTIAINDLSDANIAAPQTGEGLLYSGTAWENQPLAPHITNVIIEGRDFSIIGEEGTNETLVSANSNVLEGSIINGGGWTSTSTYGVEASLHHTITSTVPNGVLNPITFTAPSAATVAGLMQVTIGGDADGTCTVTLSIVKRYLDTATGVVGEVTNSVARTSISTNSVATTLEYSSAEVSSLMASTIPGGTKFAGISAKLQFGTFAGTGASASIIVDGFILSVGN